MNNTTTLAPSPVSDLTVWPFPSEGMTSASRVFEKHWAFSYNVAAIPSTALELLSPVVAGAAMAFSSVSVVASALTLRRRKGDRP